VRAGEETASTQAKFSLSLESSIVVAMPMEVFVEYSTNSVPHTIKFV
jgi:hypothetical protein